MSTQEIQQMFNGQLNMECDQHICSCPYRSAQSSSRTEGNDVPHLSDGERKNHFNGMVHLLIGEIWIA